MTINQLVTREALLMGRDQEFPLTSELEGHLAVLLERIHLFQQLTGLSPAVGSGYRPGHYNAAAGGAQNSPHLTCEAVDFRDVDQSLAKFCVANVAILEKCQLWMEDPHHTPVWVHLQTRAVASGHRIFIP